MAQEIDELITKIQQEGVAAAEEKAAKIEAQARLEAGKIIQAASAKAAGIEQEAELAAQKLEESTLSSLKQAGRDFLITLRAQVNEMLDNLVAENIRQSLTPEELAGLISAMIKGAANKTGGQVEITLSEQDRKHLEKFFLKKLVEETKAQITLKSSTEIGAGLRISFDAGKSHFDFSDTALAEYITANIKPELSRILKIG